MFLGISGNLLMQQNICMHVSKPLRNSIRRCEGDLIMDLMLTVHLSKISQVSALASV